MSGRHGKCGVVSVGELKVGWCVRVNNVDCEVLVWEGGGFDFDEESVFSFPLKNLSDSSDRAWLRATRKVVEMVEGYLKRS